jgi:DNA-binding beta-propeller fold protein YncE
MPALRAAELFLRSIVCNEHAVQKVTLCESASRFAVILLATTTSVLLAASLTSAQTVAANLPVGVAPSAVAVNFVTDKIYVANYGSAPGSTDGSVTIIDGATNSISNMATGSSNPFAVAVNTVTNTVFLLRIPD